MKKNLLLSIIFLISSFCCFSADLEYPSIVDGGGVNLRFTKYIPEKNQWQDKSYKSLFVKIKNISHEIIYIYSYTETPNYSTEIKNKGNYIFMMPIHFTCLYPNDSIFVPTYFYAQYFDSLSLSGEKLISDLKIYYRKASSYSFDSITIRRQFNVYSKDEVMFSSFGTYSFTHFQTVDTNSVSTRGYLINLSKEPIIVDSIKYSYTGDNFVDIGYSKGGTIYSLPFELDTLRRLSIGVKLKLNSLNPEFNKFPVTIYGHYKESGEDFELSDTLIFTVILKNKLNFLANLVDLIKDYPAINANEGDTASIMSISSENYTLTKWNLINVDTIAPIIEDVINSMQFDLPLEILPDSTVIAGKTIGSIKYYCRKAGKDTIMLTYDFENEQGEKIQHTALAYINIIPKTSVAEDVPFIDEQFIIYPNPISEGKFLNIRLNSDISSNIDIYIYNLDGSLVESTKSIPISQGQFKYAFKNDLPTGIYMLMINEKDKRWLKPLHIIK